MLLRHGAVYLLARGLPGLANFVALAVLSHLLAPADYGRYALLMALVYLGYVLAFQWLQLGTQRYLPGRQGTLAPFLSTLVRGFGFTLALSLVPALALLAWPDRPWSLPWVCMGLAVLWATAWFELNQQVLAARFRPRRYGLLGATRSLGLLGLGVPLAALGWGPWAPLTGLLLGMVLGALLFHGRPWLAVPRTPPEPGLLQGLARYGLPLAASLALGLVIAASDRLMLGWLLNEGAVGRYAVGYDLAAQVLGMSMAILATAGNPWVMQAWRREGSGPTRHRQAQYLFLLLGISLPLALALGILAGPLAALFLGPAFAPTAATVMPWIAVATLLNGLKAHYLDLAFQLRERTRLLFWVLAPAALLNLALNACWIPRWGGEGAAWASLAAQALAFAGSLVLGRRLLVLPLPWRPLAPVVGGSVLFALALWPVRTSTLVVWAPTLLFGAALYAVLLWLTDPLGLRQEWGGGQPV